MKAALLSIRSVAALIFLCGPSFAIAQPVGSKGSIETSFDEADKLLGLAIPYPKPPRSPNQAEINTLLTLLARLKKIEDTIKNYQPSGKETVEWWARYNAYLAKLNRRRAAYNRVLQGLGPPANRELQQGDYEQCANWIKSYLSDSTSPPAFIKTASSQDIRDQKNFLKELIECLGVFSKNDSDFVRATPLLVDLFITKRIPSDFIRRLTSGQIQQLIDLVIKHPDFFKKLKPDQVQQLIDVVLEHPNSDVAINLIVEYLNRESDAQRAVELLRKLLASKERHTVQRIFEAIIADSENDPQKLLPLAELLVNWPKDKRREEVIQPLLQVLNRTRDADLLAIIFRELNQQIPDTAKQKTEKILQLVESNLFGRKGQRYTQAQRLQDLVQHAGRLHKRAAEAKKILAVLPFYRVGELQAYVDTSHVTAMREELVNAFKPSYAPQALDDPDSTHYALREKRQNAEAGDKISWQSKARDLALYVAGTFEYPVKGRTLKLYLRFFDGQDDLALAGFDEDVEFSGSLKAFKSNLAKKFGDVAERLAALLNAYLDFQDITQTELSGLFDREKLKSYLAYGSYFNVEFAPTFLDDTLWVKAEAIYFAEFDYKGNWQKLEPFRQTLRARIHATYPWLPVESEYAEGQKKYLTIAGRPHGDSQRAYDIELGVNLTKAMTITLNFREQASKDQLTRLQIESSLRFVIQTINSYLGINYQQVQKAVQDSINKLLTKIRSGEIDSDTIGIPTKKPAWTNALPSLFLAGSSQFLIAKHKNSSWKNWRYLLGSGLLLGQVGTLGVAMAKDRDAVESVNVRETADVRLKERNTLLYAAGGVALISAIIAGIDIGATPKQHKNQNTRDVKPKNKQ